MAESKHERDYWDSQEVRETYKAQSSWNLQDSEGPFSGLHKVIVIAGDRSLQLAKLPGSQAGSSWDAASASHSSERNPANSLVLQAEIGGIILQSADSPHPNWGLGAEFLFQYPQKKLQRHES